MKRIAKILCVLLTVSLMLSLFAACGDRGEIIAFYNGTPVYESEVQDIINYNLVTQLTESTSESDLQAIMQAAVQSYVKYKAMEIDLEKKGYTVDEKALKENIKAMKANIKEQGMSYSEWCDTYRVSKDFLEEDLRRYALATMYREYIEKDVTVTEEEIKEYYNSNALSKYMEPAGYYWTAIIRPVKDIADAAEAATAKTEMQGYLDKILNKTMTFDEVNTELKSKYNVDNGYMNALYAGSDFTHKSDMVMFEDRNDLNTLITEIGNVYKDRDATADSKSKAYSDYMNYRAEVFRANVYFALQNLNPGEVWTEVVESYGGSYILRLDKLETTSGFIPLEEVEGEIVATLMNQKMEEKFVSYLDELVKNYQIVFYFA